MGSYKWSYTSPDLGYICSSTYNSIYSYPWTSKYGLIIIAEFSNHAPALPRMHNLLDGDTLQPLHGRLRRLVLASKARLMRSSDWGLG